MSFFIISVSQESMDQVEIEKKLRKNAFFLIIGLAEILNLHDVIYQYLPHYHTLALRAK